MVESNVADAPVCGSVNTTLLALTVPPAPVCGLVVVMVMSPSILEFPETSNFNVGVLPIPKLPEPSRISSAVPP